MGCPRVFARGQALCRAEEGNAGDALQPGDIDLALSFSPT